MLQPRTSASTASYTVAQDAVMAWARRSSDGAIVHVSMLSRPQTGQACGCICAGCGGALQAVNAGKEAEHFERPRAHRMSFRHQPGMQRSDCATLASRAALIGSWIQAGTVVLPERRASASHVGASGASHLGSARAEAEHASISASVWIDTESAMLTLADGRQVLVTLRAHVSLAAGVHAVLTVNTDDPDVAAMSLEEILATATLLVDHNCWVRHWDDVRLTQEAHGEAYALAAARMDALPVEGDFDNEPFAAPDFLRSLDERQRGETLLHLHLKQLLSRLEMLNVPACPYPVRYHPPGGGAHLDGAATIPAVRLLLSNARLEQRLGNIVPDVLCDAQVDGDLLESWPLLLEVAVTHRVSGEKADRLRARQLARLELDAKRLCGGGVLTQDQLEASLRAPQADSLYWVFHRDLEALIDEELKRLAAEHLNQQKRYAKSRAYNQRLAEDLLDREEQERKLLSNLNRLSARLRRLPPKTLLRHYVEEVSARTASRRPWSDRWHDVFARALRQTDFGALATPELQPVLLALHDIKLAGHSGDRRRVAAVAELLELGLTDEMLQPFMPILLGAARRSCWPDMDDASRAVMKRVREQVWADIQTASPNFIRPQTYDGPLATLYPELRDLLLPGQPGTRGYANHLLLKESMAAGISDLPRYGQAHAQRETARPPVPSNVVEASLGPADGRNWTIGGKVPFEQWSQYKEVAKLAPWHRNTIQQAYWAREQGKTVLEFVRSLQPRDEAVTRHCLELLASVFLLA